MNNLSINEKMEKFEELLNNEISKLYRELELKKIYFEDMIKNGFTPDASRKYSEILQLETRIQTLEETLDSYGVIFERGNE